MKRLLLFAMALAPAMCFAQAAPAWLSRPEKEFPSKEYIRASGEGASVQAAKNAALAELALSFNVKIDVVTQAVQEASSAAADGEQRFSSSKSLKQISNVRSSAEFFSAAFTEPYYSKKADKYSVLAYINKKEASEVYKARIGALSESIAQYKDYAAKEKEPFLAAEALGKADALGILCERYIHNELAVVPQDSKKYSAALQEIATVKNERMRLKKGMTFSIKLLQKDQVYYPVFSKIASILERDGYSYSLAGAAYTVVADIACAEEIYDAGPFVRPSVDITIVNADGRGVYSYSKAFQRIGSKSMDQAYIRAVTKINQDLEENFLAN